MKEELKVPKLRFKEFSGEWEEKSLGNIFKISAGGDIESTLVSMEKTEVYKYPIYANAEKNKGFYGYSKIYKEEENALTVAGRGVNLGIAHARSCNYYPIVRLLTLRPKKNENIYFFEYAINNLKMAKESTGVPQLTAPQISSYKVSFCSLQEQQKIADFLSKVDEKIEKLTKKKELLEQYKKGVMQKIFSQEIRFKDDNGNDFPEWEEKFIDEIFTVTRGYVLSSRDTTSNTTIENTYPVYSSQTKNKGLMGYYNTYLYENAITWTTDGANAGDVNFREGKFYCTNVCGVLLNEQGYANTCIAEMLNTVTHKYVSYVGNPKLMNNVMSKIQLLFPSLPEQQKIADFLSTLDKKIDIVDKELGQVQEFKKGLLQQMFV